jgi:hypothetical protein
MKAKYIMFRDDDGHGIGYPVIFSELMTHKEMAVACSNKRWGVFGTEIVAVSAGFVNTATGDCYGESTSTGLKANPDFDNVVMRQQLGIGE